MLRMRVIFVFGRAAKPIRARAATPAVPVAAKDFRKLGQFIQDSELRRACWSFSTNSPMELLLQRAMTARRTRWVKYRVFSPAGSWPAAV